MSNPAAILEKPPVTSTARADAESPPCGPPEFCEAFFAELSEREIEYVILHGHEALPDRISSDIDFAVRDSDLPKLHALIFGLAAEHGWLLVQKWQHELFACYYVAIDPRNPENSLALDACSHFVKDRCFLLPGRTLLEGRVRNACGLFVPAPAVEFIYLLAKALAKRKPMADYLPRLRELWLADPAGAENQFAEVFGETPQSVKAWLFERSDWQELEALMRARRGYGLSLLIAEGCRRLRRLANPGGMHIALLGPDGSGKTTLIANLERTLAPVFTRLQVFKFRPDCTNRIEPEHQPAPHLRSPRSTLVSWAKVLFYFADWCLGYLLRIWPALRRGELVIFDRNFDDLVVDQRRYLVQGSKKLAAVLRPLVPRTHATFLLDANPELVHARKPELPVEELSRQREEFRRLAWGNPRYRVVNADAGAQAAAGVVTREILTALAAREERRAGKLAKRAFDLAVASAALVSLSPLLLILAALVRLRLGAPIIFKQTRPGLYGRPFTICKFRTMTDQRDASGKLLPDADRLTPFGRFLRSTSLDELPELYNVLRGDMSIVGPRPLLMDYLPLYSRTQRRRHDVLPGITGWAQVNGRNAASWTRKFAYDLWYIDHQSLWLDVKIIARTAWKVLRREGITQPGRATADRFYGDAETHTGKTKMRGSIL